MRASGMILGLSGLGLVACNGLVEVDVGKGELVGAPASAFWTETGTARDATCENDEQFADEGEPNGDGDLPPEVTLEAASLEISGTSATCGNDGEDWTGDADWIGIRTACRGETDFTLTWTGAADLDFALYEVGQNEPMAVASAASLDGEEALDMVLVTGDVLLEVECWEGPDGVPWTLRIDFEPGAGDDDASGDDDDAGDDDAGDDDAGDDDGGGGISDPVEDLVAAGCSACVSPVVDAVTCGGGGCGLSLCSQSGGVPLDPVGWLLGGALLFRRRRRPPGSGSAEGSVRHAG